MPTYEYACTSCGHHLEISQSFSDEPLTTCPNCGGPLRKVFGSIGIVLKGSGFYRTDSRASSGKTATKEKDKESKKETASSSSGEAAPSSPAAPSSGTSSPAPSSSSSSSDGGSSKAAAAAG